MSPLQSYTRARIYPLWDALVDMLNADANLATLLRGGPTNAAKNRVYLPDDAFGEDDGLDGTPWMRGIILPATGPVAAISARPNGQSRLIRFVLRFDVADYAAQGWRPFRPLEGAHARAYLLLRRYAPTNLAGLRFTSPVQLVVPWQETAQRDADAPVWWLSAEYSANVTSPP